GRRRERRGPRPGAVRARTPPDDRRHAAAAQADQPRRTPDPGDARPARVLARLVGRGPEGHEGTLSEAPLARGAVGRAPEPEDEERVRRLGGLGVREVLISCGNRTKGSGMQARIFQRPKNAMQSGKALTDQWILDFVPAEAKKPDPLMGWAGSGDTRQQVQLRFPSKEAAIAYAEKYGINAIVHETPPRRLKLQAYADNFR